MALISLFMYHRQRVDPSAGVSSHPPGDLGTHIIRYAAHAVAENKFTGMPQIQLQAAFAFSLIACINCFNFNKKAAHCETKAEQKCCTTGPAGEYQSMWETRPGDCLVAFLVCVINILCTHVTDTDAQLEIHLQIQILGRKYIRVNKPSNNWHRLLSGLVFCPVLSPPD